MIDPLVAHGARIQRRAEVGLAGPRLGLLLGERALLAREGHGLVVAFDEVLADLGPDELQQETQLSDHRVVAQHRMAGLRHVAPPQMVSKASGSIHSG